MANKADEVFAQAVQDLRAWLVYLEAKQSEYREQMERARRKEEATPAAAGSGEAPLGWDLTQAFESIAPAEPAALAEPAAPAVQDVASSAADSDSDTWL